MHLSTTNLKGLFQAKFDLWVIKYKTCFNTAITYFTVVEINQNAILNHMLIDIIQISTYNFQTFLLFIGILMVRLLIGTSLLALSFASNTVFAEHSHDHDYTHGSFKAVAYDSLGKCMAMALKKHDGKVVKLEYKTEKKSPVYEFDIETSDGKAWEVECSVKTSMLLEDEEEVKADDPRFAALAKITLAEAKAIALAAHKGAITEVEYELESDGKASYEIDIFETDNEEVKVEIDATSGKIVEVSYENYQIGGE